MKKCSICLEEKDFSCFYKSKRGEFGLHTYCKSCIKKYKNNKNKEECIICKNIKKVDKRLNNGPICSNCNRNNKIEVCYYCKKNGRVEKRIDEKPICSKCYKSFKLKEKCSMCRNIRNVESRIDGNPICGQCQKNNRKRICKECGGLKAIHGNNLCYKCYKKIRMKNDLNFRIKELVRTRIRKNIKNNKKNLKSNIMYDKIIDFLGICNGDIKDYHIDHIFPLSAFDLSNKEDFLVAFCPENHQWLLASENISKSDKYDKEKFILFKKEMVKKYGFNYNK